MSNVRVTLVTGSGKKRVGAAVADALARRGYAVAVHYRSSAATPARRTASIAAPDVAPPRLARLSGAPVRERSSLPLGVARAQHSVPIHPSAVGDDHPPEIPPADSWIRD